MFANWTVQDIFSDFGGIALKMYSVGHQILSVILSKMREVVC